MSFNFGINTKLENDFESVLLQIGNELNDEGPLAAIEQARAMIRDGADPFTPVSLIWGSVHLDALDPEELALGRLAFAFN